MRGAHGAMSRHTGSEVKMPWFQSRLLTYSVTLQGSPLSVPPFPFPENEANNEVVARTKEMNLCEFPSTGSNTEVDAGLIMVD